MRKEKGSITVFSLLSILLITATIFSILEGTRLQELHRMADLQSQIAIESALSNYNNFLWENYHLLGANKQKMVTTIERVADARNYNDRNLLQMKSKDAKMMRYTLLTDEGGKVFIHSVSSYMQDNFLYETAKELYNQYEVIKNIMGKNSVDLSNIETAIDELENVNTTQKTKMIRKISKTKATDTEKDKSVLSTVENWMEKGILELVVKNTQEISSQEVDFSNGLLARNLECGNSSIATETDWKDRIMLQQYLLTYLSNYNKQEENRALTYELEYLIGKSSSDIENLKVVVTELLAIREAVNMLYLVSNPTMMAEVDAMALLLAGASANPIVFEVVKIGLITAWVFAESILDVRALLAGRKIALLKSEDTWTVELENLGMLSEDFIMAKECQYGLDYKNYLGILLLFKNEQDLAMHTMNLQEAAIQKNNIGGLFYMDSLVIWADVQVTYSYQTMFPFLSVIDAEERWERKIQTNASYGYYGKAGRKG